MSEVLRFHFEGALADLHKMNFYESARFQYAAARLMVKLAQFRRTGSFVKKITNNSNFDILLASQSDGSFNINVEEPTQQSSSEEFIKISISDLIAYVSERIIEKIDETTLSESAIRGTGASTPTSALDQMARTAVADSHFLSEQPSHVQDLVKRRIAESYREDGLERNQPSIARIDFARSQKLIAMSAPLLSEMATALRRSADTLEVTSSAAGHSGTILFLDRKMAQDIETAVVDESITPILGDITQFNKDNGWGKLKIEGGTKTLSFNIPYDLLPTMRKTLIDNMKRDMVYLQAYFVRDRSNEVIRLIAVGILPTPTV